MSKYKEMWRINMYRVVSAMGGPSMLDMPVWKVWASDTTILHSKPDPTKYVSGSRREGDKLYDTEKEAWSALLNEFDEWTKEKRAAIVRAKENA